MQSDNYNKKNKKKLIVLSSPSGGGKSTIARILMKKYPKMRFSISATTRQMRPKEKDGVHYYFLDKETFLKKIENGEFVEYEEIFDNYYGTLRSEISDAMNRNEILLFDIDVKGALSLKDAFPNESLLIFISPPSLETLNERLSKRSTESDEQIAVRLARSEMEMSLADKFDYIVINETLDLAVAEIEKIVAGQV